MPRETDEPAQLFTELLVRQAKMSGLDDETLLASFGAMAASYAMRAARNDRERARVLLNVVIAPIIG